MDLLDERILDVLTTDGRMTWAELAGHLGLSAPSAAERVRRLEEHGVIKGFTAMLDPLAIGLGLTAFVAVTLARPQDRSPFLEMVRSLDEVQECHHVAGDDDYLLKVRCRDARHLDRLLSDHLKSLEGVVRTRTTIALDTLKDTCRMPLAGLVDAPAADRP